MWFIVVLEYTTWTLLCPFTRLLQLQSGLPISPEFDVNPEHSITSRSLGALTVRSIVTIIDSRPIKWSEVGFGTTSGIKEVVGRHDTTSCVQTFLLSWWCSCRPTGPVLAENFNYGPPYDFQEYYSYRRWLIRFKFQPVNRTVEMWKLFWAQSTMIQAIYVDTSNLLQVKVLNVLDFPCQTSQLLKLYELQPRPLYRKLLSRTRRHRVRLPEGIFSIPVVPWNDGTV